MIDIGGLVSSIYLDTTNFMSGVRNVLTNTGQIQRSFNSVSKSVVAAGAELSALSRRAATFAAATGAGLTVAINQAANFEKGILNIGSILDNNSRQMLPQYSSAIKELSMALGEGYGTLNKALYDIISSNIDAKDAIDLLTTAAVTARAGLTTTAVAGDALTTMINSFQVSAKSAMDISDLLFFTVKRGKVTFEQLAPAIGSVAAQAAMAGLSLEELASMFATLTIAGVSADETATAINNVLLTFTKAGPESMEMARRFGFELEANTLRTIGLVGVIQKLNKATEEQINVMFPNIRAIRGMSAALGNAGTFMKFYNEASHRSGQTLDAFKQNAQGAAFSIDQMKAVLTNLCIELGQVFTPYVAAATGKIRTLTDELVKLIHEHRDLIFQVGKLALGFLVLAPVLLYISMIIPLITGAFKLLGTVAVMAWSAVFSPVAAVVAILAIVAATAYMLYLTWRENFMGCQLTVMEFRDTVKRVLHDCYEWVKRNTSEMFTTILNMFRSFFNTVVGLAKGIGAFLGSLSGSLFTGWKESLEDLKKVFVVVFADIADFVYKAFVIIGRNGLSGWKKTMEELGALTFETMISLGNDVYKAAEPIANKYAGVWKNAVTEFKNAVYGQDYFSGYWEKLSDGYRYVAAVAPRYIDSIKGDVKGLYDYQRDLMGQYFNTLKEGAAKDFGGVGKWFKNLFPGTSGFMSDILKMVDKVKSAGSGIALPKFPDSIPAVPGVKSRFNEVTKYLTDLQSAGIKTSDVIMREYSRLQTLFGEAEKLHDAFAQYQILEQMKKLVDGFNMSVDQLNKQGIDTDAQISDQIRSLELLRDAYAGNTRIVTDLNEKIFELQATLNNGLVTENVWTQMQTGFSDAMREMTRQMSDFKTQTKDALINIKNEISNGLGNAIADIVTGTKTAKEAFADFAKSVISMIIKTGVQMAINFAMSRIMMAVLGATGATAAATTASAWAPAAAMVSLATFGANSAPAIAGMITANATAMGLAASSVPAVAGSAGAASGFATGIDRVPYGGYYKLHEGEQVIPKYSEHNNANTNEQPLIIYNMITPEAVAMAMSSDHGKNVIVNTVSKDSMANGPTRKAIKRG